MALVDPNIAMGYRGLEMPNQLAQYGQLSAIQNAQNQNALAQYQLGSAQRQDFAQTDLAEAYKNSISPETGQIDSKLLMANVAKSRAAYMLPEIQAKMLESQTKQATLLKTNQETDAGKFKLAQDKLKHGWNSMGEASTPQAAIEKLKDGVKQGYFDEPTALKEAQSIMNMTPDQYKQYRIQKVMGMLEAKDQLAAMLPNIARQDTGSAITPIQNNPMLDGYGQPVAGMAAIPKTQTFADITAANQAATSSGQLKLAKDKFAFEQANPGMTIQEDASGLLAVNNRTGVAVPVVYGQTGFQPAPAAAPVAGSSVMRQPGVGMPGQRTPAIPGMSSVLDQTAAPAAMPRPSADGMRMAGQPVSSKKEAPAKFNDTDMQLAGLAGSLKDFKTEVGKNLFTGAKFVPSGADTAAMTAKYTALLMGVKDLYTLGALTGPDMSIIESQITNPASWSGKFTTKKGFEEQTKVIEDMLKRSTTNLETTYGRIPKASRKALQSMEGGAASGIGVDLSNPLLSPSR
jgi:hypothetical protein